MNVKKFNKISIKEINRVMSKIKGGGVLNNKEKEVFNKPFWSYKFKSYEECMETEYKLNKQ